MWVLKQAPRVWYEHLHAHLVKQQFKRCPADNNMYVSRKGADFMIVLVYVDDFILASNRPTMLQQFKQAVGACAFCCVWADEVEEHQRCLVLCNLM